MKSDLSKLHDQIACFHQILGFDSKSANAKSALLYGYVQDFPALMLHHVVTVALLLISYVINLVSIGLVIAVIHDVADVFLEVCAH